MEKNISMISFKKKYPKNSAGSLMTDKVPIALTSDLVFEIEKYLKRKKNELESINYIYVVNNKGILKGAVSIKEIFRQNKKRKISDYIINPLISVSPSVNGERVANLALKNNIKSVPVVDRRGKLLGVVLSDTILDISYREIQEDIALLAGVHASENFKDFKNLSSFSALKNRLPWLIIGMIGGFLMSRTITSFESTLEENIIIASFIPLIVYMGAAVQTQIGYFIVRDFAFNPKINFWRYIWKQLRVVFLIGLSSSIILFSLAFLIYRDLLLVTILVIAMFLAILSAIITGVCIPFIFHRFKFDPANASGPIATILQDLISIIIYLLVAKSFL
jgi:magnesium transporter